MTVSQAISQVDSLKVNMFSIEDKINWLSRLDWKIYKEIICTHQYNDGEEEVTYDGYTVDDMDTDMIAGEPYSEMYIHWLEAQIDYNNMEFESFNNSNSMFDANYSAFRNAYNASHLPIGRRRNYF